MRSGKISAVRSREITGKQKKGVDKYVLAQMNYNCVQMEQNYYTFVDIQNIKYLTQMLNALFGLLKENNILNKEK